MSDRQDPKITVRNNREELRYEVLVDDVLAGFTTYTVRDGAVTFRHAEVFPRWEGHGIGSRLASEALDDAIAAGHSIVPLCPFIDDFVSRHPSYLAYVKEPYRSEIEAKIATDPDATEMTE